MSFIFISYSREDKAYVSLLLETLQDRQLPFWLDEHIEHGEAGWNRMIEKRLEKCGVFLIVMTPNARESLWVQNELSRAINLHKPIFPILLSGSRWLDVESIQVTEVTYGNLPPNSFFQRLQLSLNSSVKRGSAEPNSTLPNGCGLHITRLLFAYLIALGIVFGGGIYFAALLEISNVLPSNFSQLIEDDFSGLLTMVGLVFSVVGGLLGYRIAKSLSRWLFYR